MSILKQRVPLCTLDADGQYRIRVEWLKDLQGVIAAITTTTTTATATTSTTDVTALTAAVADLTARVAKLEGGYQA